MVKNKALEEWVRQMADLCEPDHLVWIDGSEEQKEALEKEAVTSGELISLDQVKWPGYGENLRVLNWILKRAEGQAGAIETPLGYMPGPDDLDLEGLEINQADLDQLFAVNRDAWLQDEASNRYFFEQFESHLPAELFAESQALIKRLGQLPE